MASHIRKNKIGLIIALLLLLIALIGFGHIFSFYNLGSTIAQQTIYVNTYAYPSLAQLPATINYQFSSSYQSTSGSCQTQVEYFNLGQTITEFDAPINGVYPISQKYVSPSQQGVNLAICIISLPIQQYNTTTGTLYLTASANGYSNQVSVQLTLPSQYSEQSGGGYQFLLITIPIGSATTTSTTSTTTTIPTTSTIQTTSTIPTTSIPATTSISTATTTATTTIPPSTQQPPISQSNFFSNIASAIQTFINSIIQAFARWFAI